MIKTIQNKIFILSKKYSQKVGLDLPYFIKNGFWVTFRQGVGIISGLALSIVFARFASQEVFGQYQFILSILSIVSILSIPGLNTSIIQSVTSGHDGDYKKVVKTSFLWSLLGVPILLIIGGYYYVCQSHSLGIVLMISSVFFPFFYAPNTWDSFLQGKSRFDIAAKYSSVQAIINTLATIAVIFFKGSNLILIMITYLISYTFFNWYYYIKSLKYVENTKNDAGVIAYGWFLTKTGILNIIAGNIDRIIVGVFLSQSQLAVYAIGVLLSKQLQNITKSFLSISVPKQIKQYDISGKNYLKIFTLSLFVLILFWLMIPSLIPLLFSDKYIEAVSLSRISLLFYPIFVISVLYKNKFLYNKNQKVIKMEAFIAPAVKIFLTLVLLPFFGISGLAFLFGFQYVLSLGSLYLIEKIGIRENSNV